MLTMLCVAGCSTRPDVGLRKIERIEQQREISNQDLVYLLETACAEGNSFIGSRARGALLPKASIKLCRRILSLRSSLKMQNRCFNGVWLGVVSDLKAGQGIVEFETPRIIGESLVSESIDQDEVSKAWQVWLAELEGAQGELKKS